MNTNWIPLLIMYGNTSKNPGRGRLLCSPHPILYKEDHGQNQAVKSSKTSQFSPESFSLHRLLNYHSMIYNDISTKNSFLPKKKSYVPQEIYKWPYRAIVDLPKKKMIFHVFFPRFISSSGCAAPPPPATAAKWSPVPGRVPPAASRWGRRRRRPGPRLFNSEDFQQRHYHMLGSYNNNSNNIYCYYQYYYYYCYILLLLLVLLLLYIYIYVYLYWMFGTFMSRTKYHKVGIFTSCNDHYTLGV